MSDGGRYGLKLFAQRVSLTWLTSMLVAVSAIIALPVITKTLTPDEYGRWVLITTTLGVASIVATLSLNLAIYRFFPGAPEDEKRDIVWSITAAVFALSLVCSAAIAVMYLLGIGSSFLSGLDIVVLVMVTVPLYCLATILPAYFIGMRQMKLYSVVLLLQSYGELALYLYMVRYGVVGLVASILAVRVAMLVLIFYFMFMNTGFVVPRFRRFREMMGFNLPLFSTKISQWIVESSDRYIIDFFLTERAVAMYSPGYSLGTMSYMIVSPIESMLTVTVSEHFEHGHIDEVKKYLEYSLKYLFLLMVPAFFGLSVLAPQILVYLTRQEYATVSAQFTVFTALSMLLLSICAVMSPILMLYKKTQVIGAAWAIAAAANFFLNLVMVPWLGIIGAAITTLIAYAVIFAYVTHRAYRLLPFSVDWAFLAKCIISASVMASLIWYVSPQSLVAVVLAVPAGAIVYMVIMFALRAFKGEEMALLREMAHI